MFSCPLAYPEGRKLALLAAYSAFLALLLYFVQLGQLSWSILLLSAVGWFALEAGNDRKRLVNALKIGVFLLLFDFLFENSGWVAGLWETGSAFHLGVVPIEVMGIALFGGAAWALYLPKKFSLAHSIADSAIFALGGSLGEWLLIRQGLFQYHLWWTSVLAFIAYFCTWVLLHFIRYRVVGD